MGGAIAAFTSVPEKAVVILSGTTISGHGSGVGGGIGAYAARLEFRGSKNVIRDNTVVNKFLSGRQILNYNSTVIFTECPPGKYFDSPLPFTNDDALVGCPNECKAGKVAFAVAERINDCPNCRSGYYCPSTVSKPIACSGGKYNPSDRKSESTACLNCPTGYYTRDNASVLCLPCGPGRYMHLNQTGQTSCQKCTVGQYRGDDGGSRGGSNKNDDNQAPSCKSCKAGRGTSAPGATFCSPCAKGKISSGVDGVCQDCPVNTHQNQEEQSTCRACPIATQTTWQTTWQTTRETMREATRETTRETTGRPSRPRPGRSAAERTRASPGRGCL